MVGASKGWLRHLVASFNAGFEPVHSGLQPDYPVSRRPAGFTKSRGTVAYCSSSFAETLNTWCGGHGITSGK